MKIGWLYKYPEMVMTITTVLGVTREVTQTYEDGSYICPFCNYPTKGVCNNPVCEASPHWTEETLSKFIKDNEEKRLEQERWQKDFRRIYGG